VCGIARGNPRTSLTAWATPKKPVLVRAFKPMGYDCQAERATFTLRRRTLGHLTVEIRLDVGTWRRSVIGSFSLQGVGFSARLRLPVSNSSLPCSLPRGQLPQCPACGR
jgi:hypothetical protein